MDVSYIHRLFLECTAVCTDTRKIIPKSIFIALRGDTFDANTFAREAIDKGASYVIIDDKSYYIDYRTILVQNCLVTLQELAKFHRSYLKLPIVALTGSNGKTTTKELIKAVLSRKYKTVATVGNLNNHIGVPLTLLSFNADTEIGIVEMGANHQKEIAFLCELATPDFGYITNFGKAHLEGFGGVEGVIKGKSEMYDYIRTTGKLAFINLEDHIQVEKSAFLNHYSFGTNKVGANVNISDITANSFVVIKYADLKIQTNLIGLYNANNVNAALAIGKYFNVPNLEIKLALESYVPENNRSQLIFKRTNKIILDAYNANPSSMAVAIANCLQLEGLSKFMILGDMFELGGDSFVEHLAIVQSLLDKNYVQVCFVGRAFFCHKVIKDSLHFFETFDSFSSYFSQLKIEGHTILIKGSRGMALERALDLI